MSVALIGREDNTLSILKQLRRHDLINDMERLSKKELLIRVDEQEKSLQKYKARLHDVVESYKNLIKEKEALEASVRVLTEASNQTSENAASVISDEGNDVKNADVKSPESETASTVESLKLSLRTLIAEKTRIENELKTDRKKLLKDKDDIQEQWHQSEERLKSEKSKYENITQELKKQIRDQQKEREKEQQNNALMMKELQSLVADERSAKEKLEQQIDNLKLALERLPDKRFEYEKRINELQNELQAARELLQVAEGEKRDMPSLLRQLQQEMAEMKFQHQEAVEREVLRANKAEEKLKALAKVSEERAASLESRLSELSQMVGNYDKLRQQDQIAIQKLKDRVTQLDQENSALARTVAHSEKATGFDDDANVDIHTLIDRMNKLKSSLRLAYQRTKKSSNISDILNEALKDDDMHIHSTCQKEISKLKEDIEQYKLRIQSTKAKSSMDVDSSFEITSLKQNIASLHEKLQIANLQLEDSDAQCKKLKLDFQKSSNEIKCKHEQELKALHADYQMKLSELEHQMQKQRELSLKLLEEKEKEINFLRSSVLPLIEEGKQVKKEADVDTSTVNGESSRSSIPSEELLDLLSNSVKSAKKGSQILHYTQEIARKDVELSNLRKARLKAESSLRELQQTSLLKEEKFQNEVDALKSQIKRMESVNKGINMEYLKNVFLRFIQNNDPNDRSHMINAIAAILHFTPRELQEIKFSKHSW